MDTNPTLTKNDDTLGVTFSNNQPVQPTPKGLLGSDAPKIGIPQSHLSDGGRVFDVGRAFTNEHIDTGTIVSDKKRSRPTLGENLQSAFSEWWENTTKTVSHIEKNVTTPVQKTPLAVPKATTRIDVVKKAATHATIAPRDDHRVVVEKFRTFKQDVARLTGTSVTIKEPVKTEPTWSHTTDELNPSKAGVSTQSHVPDIRHAMIAPVVEERVTKNIKDFVPTQKVPKINEKKAPSFIPATIQKEPTPTAPKSPVHIAPEVHHAVRAIHDTMYTPPQPKTTGLVIAPEGDLPRTVKQQEMPAIALDIPKQDTPEESLDTLGTQEFHSTTPSSVPVERPTLDTLPQATAVQKPLAHNTAFKTFLMKWAILILIVLLGIALAVIASFYFNVFEKSPAGTPVETTVPAFFETSQQNALPFDSGKQVFLETLIGRIGTAPSGIVQIYPTVPDGMGTRPATSEEVLALFSAGLSGKAMRSLEDTIMIGSVTVTSNEPFIILRSYNFDVLFSGFLEWEKTMYADLAPLFGPLGGTTGIFKDAVRDNKSIRILSDTTGNEVLIYSFIDKNTVVITSSAEALAQIISQF